MNKKNRLIILLVCVALFFIITPYLVLYSMGYRVDFETWEITSTGGIYVSTNPQAEQIIIDSENLKKPGIFSNSVFIQDLIPKDHTVLITKEGYFDYYKTLEVVEKEVTKLEKVTLFKNTTSYNLIADKIESFYISPDNKNILAEVVNTASLDFYYFNISSPDNIQKISLPAQYTSVLSVIWSNDSGKALIKTQNNINGVAYYLIDFNLKEQSQKSVLSLNANSTEISFNPSNSEEIFYIQNNILYYQNNQKSTALLKNVLTYKIINNDILWISNQGVLNNSDILAKTTKAFSEKDTDYTGYKIREIAGNIFLTKTSSILEYNQETKTFEKFCSVLDNPTFLQSPDSKNMIYFDSKNIYLYAFEQSDYIKTNQNNVKLFSANTGETISDCYWLNNDYIIFESGNRIIISEIDFRGNINQIEIEKSWPANADSKNPKLIFDSQNNRIYILTDNKLYTSEKLLQ